MCPSCENQSKSKSLKKRSTKQISKVAAKKSKSNGNLMNSDSGLNSVSQANLTRVQGQDQLEPESQEDDLLAVESLKLKKQQTYQQTPSSS